ncbi:hypothetical protein QAD02_004602 [Eretmocerus hayati]|uniref:Uncharacterized protein n=1 Tax=Eretmocerus hayati TaxID=131215 RepID=A0ACC2NQ70_9HYME|nr:hypothetical protein QAD02_004602 [Eretmocerus hayati]
MNNGRGAISRGRGAQTNKLPKDQQRAYNRMLDKDWQAGLGDPGSWADDTRSNEPDNYRQNATKTDSRQAHDRGRINAWKNNNKKRQKQDNEAKDNTQAPSFDKSKYQSKINTPTQDEPLYTVVNASVTVQKTRVQNIDHSSFPILCDITYRKMQGIDPRLPRSVPYCSFLHYCNILLQCQLLDTTTRGTRRAPSR